MLFYFFLCFLYFNFFLFIYLFIHLFIYLFFFLQMLKERTKRKVELDVTGKLPTFSKKPEVCII